MAKKLAPIVIFIYNRPDHLKKTLENLKQCKGFTDSPVIVYADGAKNEDEYKTVKITRDTAKKILGNHAEYHFSKTNKGLSNSIIQGVTNTIGQYKQVIVIEDDLIVTPNFLSYMNEALTRYEKDNLVYQVSGYQFNVPEFTGKNSAVFLPLTVSWGWATWERAWLDFDPNAKDWEKVLSNKDLRKRFNFDGVYNYSGMLVNQMIGLRDSWAIRWYWSVFNKKGITIFPPYSLVNNTGFDGSGTHGRGVLRKYGTQEKPSENNNFRFPDSITILDNNYTSVKLSIRKQNGGRYGLLVDKIRWLITTVRKTLYY